jgi:hypothetical protein
MVGPHLKQPLCILSTTEPNAIKIQGSVITGSCKYRKNLQDPVVFKLNAIKHIFPVFTGIFL